MQFFPLSGGFFNRNAEDPPPLTSPIQSCKSPVTIIAASCALLQVDPGVQLLYDYILSRGTILAINRYDEDLLRHGDIAQHVADSIRLGNTDWEDLVPQAVRHQIKSLGLLGYRQHQQLADRSSNGHKGVNGVTNVSQAPGTGRVMHMGQAASAA